MNKNSQFDVKKVFGIYKIYNTVNGFSYVGKTADNFYNRWTFHIHDLFSGVHINKALQSDWNKYGYDVFSFEVLDVVCEKEDLNHAEKRWTDKIEYKYNSRGGG